MDKISVRTKLIILVLTILLPLTILQAYNIYSTYEKTYTNEFKASKEYAEAISTAFLNYLDSLWNLEYSIGSAITVGDEPMPPDQIDTYLENILSTCPTIKDYAWIDADGSVIAISNPSRYNPLIISRLYYMSVRLKQDKIITNAMADQSGKSLTIPIARAIRKDGELLGISVLWLDPDKLNLVLPIERRGMTGSFGFIDKHALMVYRHGNPNLPIEKRWLDYDSPIKEALSGEVIHIRKYSTHLNDASRMGVAIAIPEIGWATFVSRSVDEVLSDVRGKMIRDIFILTMVILISLFAATVLTRHFINPINKLQNAALEISKRNLKARANIRGTDELATTGQIFDEMAARIEELENNRLQFLQTAAHELRNPMSGVKGILALIKRKIEKGKSVDNVIRMMNRMEKEVDRLSNLLNQILDAFRAQRESVNLSYDFKETDLIDIVSDSIEPYQLTSEKCDIIYQPPDKAVYVKGDRSRLEEVFRNIINNAVKYSPDGGIIDVQIQCDDEYIITSIKDSGIGIPETKLQSIFDCFGRAIDPRKKDPGGMGLGLYICKEIVEKHHGEIWADSDGINGSTFYIKLPICGKEEKCDE